MEEVHFNFISKHGDLFETAELISRETYKTTRLCHSTLFGRRTAFETLMYKEDIFAEDWDLYNRALNRGMKISKVPKVLIKYRIVNSGMCGQFNEQPHIEIRKKIFAMIYIIDCGLGNIHAFINSLGEFLDVLHLLGILIIDLLDNFERSM